MAGGRPPGITDENKAVILAAIRHGVPIYKAVALADVSQTSFYNWIKWGKEWEDGGSKSDSPHRIYGEFILELQKADAEGMNARLERIDLAGEGDWHAASWIEERRHPADFGRTTSITETHEEHKIIEIRWPDQPKLNEGKTEHGTLMLPRPNRKKKEIEDVIEAELVDDGDDSE